MKLIVNDDKYKQTVYFNYSTRSYVFPPFSRNVGACPKLLAIL